MEIKSPEPQYPDCKDRHSFQSGMVFQDFVCDLLMSQLGLVIANYSSAKFQFGTGENRQGIEIKLDRDILSTGNLSIEVGEKSRARNPEYIPSGILRNDNSWLYIQGNVSIVFIFAKSLLLGVYKASKYQLDELPTLQRFLMPIEDAYKWAAKVIKVNNV